MKLFGVELFKSKKELKEEAQHQIVEAVTAKSYNVLRDSKYLPDFARHMREENGLWMYAAMPSGTVAWNANGTPKKVSKKAAAKAAKAEARKEKKQISPKGVHQLRLLHDKAFKLNMDPAYVDGQIEDFKQKLAMMQSEEYDMQRGTDEIASVLVRMENRKKYPEHKDFFDQYPYTTSSKIAAVTKKHDHLQLGQIAQFVAELPKEATATMKAYEEETVKLCGKKPVFYIIAKKKDFRRTETRRDPILLAQSPFGHFWQILGAWDEEMLFLESL